MKATQRMPALPPDKAATQRYDGIRQMLPPIKSDHTMRDVYNPWHISNGKVLMRFRVRNIVLSFQDGQWLPIDYSIEEINPVRSRAAAAGQVRP